MAVDHQFIITKRGQGMIFCPFYHAIFTLAAILQIRMDVFNFYKWFIFI